LVCLSLEVDLNKILTTYVCCSYEANLPQLPNDDALELVLEAFLLFLMTQNDEKYLPQLKTCLKCMVQLCEACPGRCKYFVELISEQISTKKGNSQFNTIKCTKNNFYYFIALFLLIETLAAMASCSPSANDVPLLLNILPELTGFIDNLPKVTFLIFK